MVWESQEYITDRYDITLALKVALNSNTTNQPSKLTHTQGCWLWFDGSPTHLAIGM